MLQYYHVNKVFMGFKSAVTASDAHLASQSGVQIALGPPILCDPRPVHARVHTGSVV